MPDSSNFTADSSRFISTNSVNLYKDNPQAGRWTLQLEWLPPLASEFGTAGGAQLSTPFTDTSSSTGCARTRTCPMAA